MQRSFGLDLVGTSQFIGAVLLIGGSAGVLAGGWLGDRLGGRDKAAYARLPAIAFVIAVPLFAAGMLSSSIWLAFALFLLPQKLLRGFLPRRARQVHCQPAPRHPRGRGRGSLPVTQVLKHPPPHTQHTQHKKHGCVKLRVAGGILPTHRVCAS